MLEKWFHLQEKGSNVKVEIIAGLTTFMTMAYIIFLNPSILSGELAGSPTGLSMDAAMLATCIAAFTATVLMGLYANFPIAQAPGMGENFFFVTVAGALAVQGVSNAWQVTLGIVFISGVIFLILSLLKFRKVMIDAVSPSMKNGIAVGIGLLIAVIGFRNAGVILPDLGTGLKFNSHILQADVMIFFAGLFFTAVLHTRKVRGAILWGILFTALLSLIIGKVHYSGIVGLPADHAVFKMDLPGALKFHFIPFIVVFLFMDLFDTMGTLIGVSEQAGLVKDNRIPGSNRALISDAVGTVVGACTGTSTVTSYIESSVGVEYGGRTGLTSVVTGFLFLAALFFSPLVAMVGKYLPITAPALVIVGSMMAKNISRIEWENYSEAIPAFLIIIGIPISGNIADGLALGFISYPVIKIFSGRAREMHWLMIGVAVLFILRYALIQI
ncbi:MAG TPA: NCS2 family permease [bacterium]|nr:NCS2 family permease [bacterium]